MLKSIEEPGNGVLVIVRALDAYKQLCQYQTSMAPLGTWRQGRLSICIIIDNANLIKVWPKTDA